MEKTINSRMIYQGKVINLRLDEVELENKSIAKREVVEHPGAVAILAITDDQQIYLVEQFRKPIENNLLEIPAGKLEKDEEPINCAKRELGEEVGVGANSWQQIAAFYTSPGFASEKIYLFLATDLFINEIEKPQDELLQLKKIPFNEAVDLARSGKIEDCKTLIAILLGADIIGM